MLGEIETKKCTECKELKLIFHKGKSLCQFCNEKRKVEENRRNKKSIDKGVKAAKKRLQSILEGKKKNVSKKKPEKLSTLIKKLDKVFSQFIRLRDTDENGNGRCVTCNQPTTYREANAGHFIRRGRHATRWNEMNVNIQDVACNKYKDGAEFEHSLYIDNKYPGLELVENDSKGFLRTSEVLHNKGKEIFKPGKPWLREQIIIYKNKVTELLKTKNFTI